MTGRPVRGLLTVVLIALSSLVAVGVAPPARADSVRDDAWYLKKLRIIEAQRITKGEGVVVAVVDSGVDPTQADITGNVLPGVDIYTGKPPARGRDGYTDYHGTAMAGLIAGHGHGAGRRNGVLGVAPKAKILPVKVTSPEGPSSGGGAVAIGMRWALKLGADIISVSLQTPTDDRLDAAVREAWNKGVPVLVATGNTGLSSLQFAKGALQISAIGSDGGFIDSLNAMFFPIGVAAPGGDVPSAQEGGYWTSTGTSNSTAIAAGVMALIKAKYPQDDVKDLYRRMQLTADDRGVGGPDNYYGYGVVDPVPALTEELPPEPTATAPEYVEPSPVAAPKDTSRMPIPVVLGGVGCLVVLLLAAAAGGLVVARRG